MLHELKIAIFIQKAIEQVNSCSCSGECLQCWRNTFAINYFKKRYPRA